ncbi:hypothetical protein Cha6605_3956 [Chamaesiphon minutus PCC 6605]|uniref:Protein kinase domain-containing protein n=1 Tax=Chamaesiphon minutus (strain ATCC 27169 / PCC 6605) TaxID=1173020 RepID=K9UL49_CHAP6|nr:hypothetical protein Cha6605_3956 [Chamaesiphon minutus PCC 6605]
MVLVDFGAAKQATQSMLAKTGTAIGSAEFAAPEQARRKPVFASDIYSLGVTCIYLLTQVSPFDLFDMNEDAWVWRDYLVNNPVDEKLGKVLDKMIANVLPQRYQSAIDVLTDLTGFARNTISTLPPSSASKLENLDLSINHDPNLEFFEFETAQIVTIKKTVKKKISLKEGVVFKRWVEHEIDEMIDVPEVQRRKGKAQQFVQDLENGVKLEMVYIPAGSFMMGSNKNNKEKPIHQVNLSPFYMGKYTITQQQYQAIMGTNPSRFKGKNRPVENISWDDAFKFCEKLSRHIGREYTLPTESQWEYACRAGTTTSFYFGETITSDLVNYSEFHKETTDVGSFPPNAFGLYDMHGNVCEWCLDTWHENYMRAPMNGSAWIENNKTFFYVLRGGSFLDKSDRCNSAFRDWYTHAAKLHYNGLRVVCLPFS